MTGSYIYCIAPEGHEPRDDLRGLDDEPVRALSAAGFSVWSSPLPEAPAPSVPRIRRHDRVVRASATNSTTPLPMRFGQWYPSRQRLERSLEENREAYGRTLRTLAGALEFGVRVIDPAVPASGERPAAESGREYLAALARERDRRDRIEARGEELREEIAAELRDLVRAERRTGPEAARELIGLAHLVPREHFDAYRARLSEFRGGRPELRFLVTGPWPPYSFVE